MEVRWAMQRVHNAGHRMTNPRQTILAVLHTTDKHLSAEDIYITALKTNSSIGLTTVYRTLDLFTQIGVVHKFDFGDGKARYELANMSEKAEHHHHLVCMSCKKIIDYSDFIREELKLMAKTEKELSNKHHFKITHHTINFYGLCQKCQN